MRELKRLALEEATKSVIDKLVFGLIAALIIFLIQQCSATNQKKQLEKEAILKIETAFYVDGIRNLNQLYRDYVSVVSKTLSNQLKPTDTILKDLYNKKLELEAATELLTVGEFAANEVVDRFINGIEQLNAAFIGYSAADHDDFVVSFNSVKANYGQLLKALKMYAAESLSSTNL